MQNKLFPAIVIFAKVNTVNGVYLKDVLSPHRITALDTLNASQGTTSNPGESSETCSILIADEDLSTEKSS